MSAILPTLLAILAAFLFSLSAHVQNIGLSTENTHVGTLAVVGASAMIYWLAAPFVVAPVFALSPIFAMLLGLFAFRRETLTWRTPARAFRNGLPRKAKPQQQMETKATPETQTAHHAA